MITKIKQICPHPEDCSNYYLYKNESEHGKGHRSLEKLVKGLLEEKIIVFENGKYLRRIG